MPGSGAPSASWGLEPEAALLQCLAYVRRTSWCLCPLCGLEHLAVLIGPSRQNQTGSCRDKVAQNDSRAEGVQPLGTGGSKLYKLCLQRILYLELCFGLRAACRTPPGIKKRSPCSANMIQIMLHPRHRHLPGRTQAHRLLQGLCGPCAILNPHQKVASQCRSADAFTAALCLMMGARMHMAEAARTMCLGAKVLDYCLIMQGEHPGVRVHLGAASCQPWTSLPPRCWETILFSCRRCGMLQLLTVSPYQLEYVPLELMKSSIALCLNLCHDAGRQKLRLRRCGKGLLVPSEGPINLQARMPPCENSLAGVKAGPSSLRPWLGMCDGACIASGHAPGSCCMLGVHAIRLL